MDSRNPTTDIKRIALSPLVRLAQDILQQAETVSRYLAENHLPQPSFEYVEVTSGSIGFSFLSVDVFEMLLTKDKQPRWARRLFRRSSSRVSAAYLMIGSLCWRARLGMS